MCNKSPWNFLHGLFCWIGIDFMPVSDQGSSDNRYKLVPRALIFLFDDKDRVLLIKGSSQKKLWSGLYNAIGGHIERGESVIKGAYRELKEETGITDVLLRICGLITIDVSERAGVVLFLFRGTYTGEVLTNSSEGKLLWKSINNLNFEEIVEDIPLLMPQVVKHQPGDPLIIGKYHYDKQGNLIVSLQ
jgi:8-oxo-dGTP pyrophosphatase MutT (NUDIX family)